MPTVNGTSQLGGQRVVGYGDITVAQFELIIPTLKASNPSKLGFGWVLARDKAVSQNVRILQRGPIYAPGVFYTFSNSYGFTNYQYAWFVNWNVANLGFSVTFA